jgi:protein SCO1/2
VPLRAQLAVALATVFVIVAAGFAILGGEEPTAEGRDTFEGSLRPPDVPPADFRLVDQDGETVTLRQFRGTPVVVTFLYTTCEDTCPLTAQQIRGALDDLGHDVPVLAIAVDPPNDTAEKARRFLAEQRMTGRMRFLLGPDAELRRQWKAYGTQRQTSKQEHSGYTILLDRRGVQRIGFPADQVTPEALAHDLALLEREPRPADPAAP